MPKLHGCSGVTEAVGQVVTTREWWVHWILTGRRVVLSETMLFRPTMFYFSRLIKPHTVRADI